MFNNDVKKELEQRNLNPNSFDYLYKYLEENNKLDKLNEYSLRLISGEAVQYIIGEVNFYGNRFLVNKNTLIPRFETELLIEKTINYIKNYFNREISILDIGTGSGVIAITLSKVLGFEVDASDISRDAIRVAKENNKLNDTKVNFIQSDIFSNINNKYDVIISNPPYISYGEEIMDIVRNNEPSISLFADNNGLYYYDVILKECSKYLNDKFLIAFEIGYKQGKKIKKMAMSYLNDIKVIIEKDYGERDRFVFIMKDRKQK